MNKVLKLFDGELVKEQYGPDISYAYIIGKRSRGFYSWVLGHSWRGEGRRTLTVAVKLSDTDFAEYQFHVYDKILPKRKSRKKK